MSMGKIVGSLRNGTKGQALVEMALTMSLLLLIVLGGVEVARIAHVALVVTNSAREGARAAAIGDSYGKVTASVRRSLGTWADQSHTIEIDPIEEHRRQGEPIEVRVIVPVPLITPVLAPIISNPFPVQSVVVMRAE